MLLKTVTYNAESPNWYDDHEFNRMYLRHVENNVNDAVRCIGYIYLNQICEYIGVRWNPKDENPCVVNNDPNRTLFVKFDIIRESDESYLIHIHTHQ